MIKLVYCITKKDNVSAGDFYRYWLEEHGPLVKSVADDLGACRYVQSHTALPEMNALLQAGRGCEPPYDGITEVWWNSSAELKQGTGSEAGIIASKRLVDDESTFIDFARSRVFMTEEHEIF